MDKTKIITAGLRVLKQQSLGIAALSQCIDNSFALLVDTIMSISGKLVLSGMGKSGIVARKIASTLSSTGTPSFYIHPSEAEHGDLGALAGGDMVMLLSNSGESAELNPMIHYCKRSYIPIISITRNAESNLARHADISIVLPTVEEASLLGAPTTSSTMMMVYGDALAVALYEQKGFSRADYKLLHPGGKIGSQLKQLRDFMHKGAEMPLISSNCKVSQAIVEISAKRLGCVGVVDDSGKLIGIISDGDLRRHIHEDMRQKTALDIMSNHPKVMDADAFASEAISLMQSRKITQLFVTEAGKPIGIVHIHDLLKIGVI